MLAINFDPALFNEMERYAQAIPEHLLNSVTLSAQKNKISIAEEITTRILATFAMPDAFGLNEKAHEILNKKFSGKEAFAETEQRRQGWLYLYEMEKLKLLLKFEKKLPKGFKESFSKIDINASIKKIREKQQKDSKQQ